VCRGSFGRSILYFLVMKTFPLNSFSSQEGSGDLRWRNPLVAAEDVAAAIVRVELL
jgi:hypothetical protein